MKDGKLLPAAPSANELGMRYAIAENPDDDAQLLIYADWLAERGAETLEYALRWMVARRQRPARRPFKSVKKPWVWWWIGAQNHLAPGEELLFFREHDEAVLSWILFKAVTEKNFGHQALYFDWWEAAHALAAGLERLAQAHSLEGGKACT